MKKLEIINKNNYEYHLKDEDDMIYHMNLEFFDIQEELKSGDYIYMAEKLLNPRYEGYSVNYVFGSLDNKYGKENIEINDIDVIKLEIEGKEIYLKRLYG